MTNLVCIHGNSLDSSIYDSVTVPGFNKISVDLPGHGGTPLGDAQSFDDMVEKVYRQIYHLSDIVLLGCSLGGHIAHHLLARLTPLGLITISAPPLNLETVAKAFNPHSAGGLLFQQTISPSDADMVAESMLSLRVDQKGYLSRLIQNTNPQAREVIAASLQRAEFQDEVQLLEKFAGDKWFVLPLQDTMINQEHYLSLKLGKLATIPGNHVLPVDNPDGLNQFLSRELAKFRK